MKVKSVLQKLAKEIGDETERNPEFEKRILDILSKIPSAKVKKNNPNARGLRASNRRPAALLDPELEIAVGETDLRDKLLKLNIEQLKDVVAEYGMDPGKLVMKWKSPDKIIDRIIEISLSRARKGDAFR